MLRLYVGRLGDAGAPLAPRISGEIANHIGYVNQSLDAKPWLMGDVFTGADIQMSFVGEALRDLRPQYPNVDAWVKRFQARPAYRKALERGGPYALAA
jgi:glutathione S-transferase